MRHRIAHQAYSHLLGNLLHDGRLPQPRRAQKKQRPLTLYRNEIRSVVVFCQIHLDRMGHFLFRLTNVHLLFPFDALRNSPESSLTRIAHGGTSGSSTYASSVSTKATSYFGLMRG